MPSNCRKILRELGARGTRGRSPSASQGGAGNWSLGGWTITTGVFVNPVYDTGKLQNIDWGYLDGGFEYVNDVVDTSRLNKVEAVVFFANRPGVPSPAYSPDMTNGVS
jgi:hypothetical protein